MVPGQKDNERWNYVMKKKKIKTFYKLNEMSKIKFISEMREKY